MRNYFWMFSPFRFHGDETSLKQKTEETKNLQQQVAELDVLGRETDEALNRFLNNLTKQNSLYYIVLAIILHILTWS
jgi:hypothetical protein